MADKTYDCIIIDSISHEWMGPGGILEMHDALPGNSYTNWGKVNPRHNKFIEAMLKSPCHIIATMRSKQAYALETNEKGKQEPKKLGLAPQQRDGLEYEFTAVLKMDVSHQAEGDKDRTELFPVGEWFKPTIQHGARLAEWLNSGVDAKPVETKPNDQQTMGDKMTSADWEEIFDNECEKTLPNIKAWRLKNGGQILATIANDTEKGKLKAFLDNNEKLCAEANNASA